MDARALKMENFPCVRGRAFECSLLAMARFLPCLPRILLPCLGRLRRSHRCLPVKYERARLRDGWTDGTEKGARTGRSVWLDMARHGTATTTTAAAATAPATVNISIVVMDRRMNGQIYCTRTSTAQTHSPTSVSSKHRRQSSFAVEGMRSHR
ncbi:hypothetical protein IWZ00DRAFT_268130 [Phyllosticta capitalensis]|uniref:Uncharacterized protein n=1 Tax=Phyllosticta capitalensis TaxID=121624 RepID=A0ABR1YPE9_9PEZI